MEVEERNLKVGGSSVRYLTAGEGPPLVLLHGVGTPHVECPERFAQILNGFLDG